MEQKLAEVADRHGIPIDLLHDVLALEREKVTLRNRRLTPTILQRIAVYAEQIAPNEEAR